MIGKLLLCLQGIIGFRARELEKEVVITSSKDLTVIEKLCFPENKLVSFEAAAGGNAPFERVETAPKGKVFKT